MSDARRVAWLDAARGLAVVAMIAFHLVWDLAHFGYIERSAPWSPPVKLFGHSIAFSFLFIAGYSLALAHRDAIGWRAFWRRLGVVAGAAALVSVGTYAAFPDAYVFFGILHVIAASSLLALPFLAAPWFVAAIAGAFILVLPLVFSSPHFDADALMWLGLGTREPMTQDWRPLFPWAGALLLGVAAGRGFARPARAEGNYRGLTFIGRHSLIIYLAHQPALFAVFTMLAHVQPAPQSSADFVAACETQCVSEGGAGETCRAICACTAQAVRRKDALAGAASDAERARRLNAIARRCAGAT